MSTAYVDITIAEANFLLNCMGSAAPSAAVRRLRAKMIEAVRLATHDSAALMEKMEQDRVRDSLERALGNPPTLKLTLR